MLPMISSQVAQLRADLRRKYTTLCLDQPEEWRQELASQLHDLEAQFDLLKNVVIGFYGLPQHGKSTLMSHLCGYPQLLPCGTGASACTRAAWRVTNNEHEQGVDVSFTFMSAHEFEEERTNCAELVFLKKDQTAAARKFLRSVYGKPLIQEAVQLRALSDKAYIHPLDPYVTQQSWTAHRIALAISALGNTDENDQPDVLKDDGGDIAVGRLSSYQQLALLYPELKDYRGVELQAQLEQLAQPSFKDSFKIDDGHALCAGNYLQIDDNTRLLLCHSNDRRLVAAAHFPTVDAAALALAALSDNPRMATLIEEVDVRGPFNIPSFVTLLDMPGFNDTSRLREKCATMARAAADSVIFVLDATSRAPSCDRVIVNALTKLHEDGKFQLMVLTRNDVPNGVDEMYEELCDTCEFLSQIECMRTGGLHDGGISSGVERVIESIAQLSQTKIVHFEQLKQLVDAFDRVGSSAKVTDILCDLEDACDRLCGQVGEKTALFNQLYRNYINEQKAKRLKYFQTWKAIVCKHGYFKGQVKGIWNMPADLAGSLWPPVLNLLTEFVKDCEVNVAKIAHQRLQEALLIKLANVPRTSADMNLKLLLMFQSRIFFPSQVRDQLASTDDAIQALDNLFLNGLTVWLCDLCEQLTEPLRSFCVDKRQSQVSSSDPPSQNELALQPAEANGDVANEAAIVAQMAQDRQLVVVPGDGHCMFTAAIISIGDVERTGATAIEFRRRLADYLSTGDSSVIRAINAAGLRNSVLAVLNSNEWGDSAELALIAEFCEVRIHLKESSGRVFEAIGNPTRGEILLAYNFLLHYDAYVLKNAPDINDNPPAIVADDKPFGDQPGVLPPPRNFTMKAGRQFNVDLNDTMAVHANDQGAAQVSSLVMCCNEYIAEGMTLREAWQLLAKQHNVQCNPLNDQPIQPLLVDETTTLHDVVLATVYEAAKSRAFENSRPGLSDKHREKGTATLDHSWQHSLCSTAPAALILEVIKAPCETLGVEHKLTDAALQRHAEFTCMQLLTLPSLCVVRICSLRAAKLLLPLLASLAPLPRELQLSEPFDVKLFEPSPTSFAAVVECHPAFVASNRHQDSVKHRLVRRAKQSCAKLMVRLTTRGIDMQALRHAGSVEQCKHFEEFESAPPLKSTYVGAKPSEREFVEIEENVVFYLDDERGDQDDVAPTVEDTAISNNTVLLFVANVNDADAQHRLSTPPESEGSWTVQRRWTNKRGKTFFIVAVAEAHVDKFKSEFESHSVRIEQALEVPYVYIKKAFYGAFNRWWNRQTPTQQHAIFEQRDRYGQLLVDYAGDRQAVCTFLTTLHDSTK